MAIEVRRVVTGHDAAGRAVVQIDEVSQEVISRRPGQSSAIIWSTSGSPVRNEGSEDGAGADLNAIGRQGTVFRVNQFEPGVTPRTHRTETVDYTVIMSGEIDLELDDGATVHLKAGDVVVQRGTLHNWVNNGTEPCTVAFINIGAAPVDVAGQLMTAIG